MGVQFLELSPMENPLVLHHIFERCSLNDLKSCRLVSRLWRDVSLVAWRSSSVCGIYEFGDRNTTADFQSFSRNYEDDQGQILEAPFTNYHVMFDDYRTDWFYNCWGSFIKILKLESTHFRFGKSFLTALFDCCQNLEELVLINVKVTGRYFDFERQQEKVSKQIDWNGIQENKKLKSIHIDSFSWEGVVWIEILSRVPSLQALTLSHSVSNSEQLFQSVKKIREQNPNKLKLRLLDLGSFLFLDDSRAILQVLLDANLNLEYLDIGPFFQIRLSRFLPGILNNHASSLKKLFVLQYFDSGYFQFTGQKQLENLQVLHLDLHQDQEYMLMKLLKLVPNIRRIIFRSSSSNHLLVEDHELPAAQDITLKNCTELELLVPNVKKRDMEHLVKWMPNLRKLKIDGLDNEMFSMVCENWPHLVRLDVRYSTIDDAGITGFKDEDVKKINGYRERGVWRRVTCPRVNANITDLKDLQRFYLSELGDVMNPSKRDFGRCAAVYGFRLLPSLKHLKIQVVNFRSEAKAFWKEVCAKYRLPEDDGVSASNTDPDLL